MSKMGSFIVVKFGGSNFKNFQGYCEVIAKIKEILEFEKEKTLVLVVSAAYGITDRLFNAVNNFQNIDVRTFLRELYDLHSSLFGKS